VEWFWEAIRRLQGIPDDQFVSYIRPYAESVANHFSGVSSDVILKTALARKHNLADEYSKFLSALLDKPIVMENAEISFKGSHLKQSNCISFMFGTDHFTFAQNESKKINIDGE